LRVAAAPIDQKPVVLSTLNPIAAVLPLDFYYHHPSHIGINIQKSRGNTAAIGFNVDKTTGFWSMGAAATLNANSSKNQSNSMQNNSLG
jgi:hypothetical protein